VRTGVVEGRAFNAYIERRMAWCVNPAPAVADGAAPVDTRHLDDESRAFLDRFPHVPAIAYYNIYGRFLGGIPPGASPPADGARMAILVLGMHRSGTSTLAASLAAAGAYLGSDLISPLPENPKGHWESREIIRTADAILAKAGSHWDDVRPIAFPDAATRATAVGELVDLLRRKFPRTSLLAIKDPRACRLASVWREALESAGFSIRVVIPIRHPAEVAASLAARNGFTVGKGLDLWMRHVLDALRHSRGLPRTIVRYEDLLARGPAELERIGAALGIRWPVADADRAVRLADFLEPGLRRQRDGALPAIPQIHELWSLVREGDAAVDRPDAAARIDAIESEFSRSLADPAAGDG
jgi:hypothetical protein